MLYTSRAFKSLISLFLISFIGTLSSPALVSCTNLSLENLDISLYRNSPLHTTTSESSNSSGNGSSSLSHKETSYPKLLI